MPLDLSEARLHRNTLGATPGVALIPCVVCAMHDGVSPPTHEFLKSPLTIFRRVNAGLPWLLGLALMLAGRLDVGQLDHILPVFSNLPPPPQTPAES